MTLSILSSNRVEILKDCLAERLAEAPLGDPFAREVVVVPTFAMGRWLNLRLAQSHGIAANIDYPQPGEWVWDLAGEVLGDLPHRDPYSADTMSWRLFALLPELLGADAFGELRGYLADDRSGIKRWQLCERIAQGFDRYLAYRPQLIRQWSAGRARHWQARLWRALTADSGQDHRVDILARLVARLQQPQAAPRLPERVSLFGLSTLPALYLEVVHALAAHTDLRLYLHSPSDQYWADLESEKRKLRRQLSHPGQQELFDAGNELLASWGRQGQVFQDQLIELGAAASIDIERYTPPDDSSLLGQLQRSIYTLEPKPRLRQADDSISLHVCHSAMRECEVLRDRLLDMLETDPSLNPEDILVMIPNIAAYSPYVEAVFQQQRVAFNLSDVSLADEHPLVTTFLQLLRLPASRFTQTEILALLDNEALRRRFDIDAGALAEIQRLIDAGRTRWGIDAAHKAELDLPATPGNTWQQLQERFFTGFALAGDELWQGISPLAASDDAGLTAMGRFWHFLGRLRAWRERLAVSRDAVQWQSLLMQLLDDFFIEADSRESRLQQIRDAVSQVSAAGNSEVSPELMVYLLERLLQTSEQHGQLYSGGITFCGMRPMRSIPFRVICLLGMNHDDFPRRDPPSDFELVAAKPRAGDPSRRLEDRYLMLETLLCARHKLYLSYTGRNLRDNSEQPPSVLVQELLDFIDTHFEAAPGDPRPSSTLTRLHPMQPFTAASFVGAEFSYSEHWSRAARQLASPISTAPKRWPRDGLQAAEPSAVIHLDRLRRFVADPVRSFFQQRLGIYLRDEQAVDDDEPFELSFLDAWQLRQRLANDCLAGREESVERLRAEGMLPHGTAAAMLVERVRREEAAWLESIAGFRNIASQALPIDIAIAPDLRLEGSLTNYFPGVGLMSYQAGKFKGKHLLTLWIDHLALCAAGLAGSDEASLLLSRNGGTRIPLLDAAEAQAKLEDYSALYAEGLCRPLPVLPETSHPFAEEADGKKALNKAIGNWNNPYNPGGDRSNPYLQLVLRAGHGLPFADDEFDRYARRIYARLLDVAEAV